MKHAISQTDPVVQVCVCAQVLRIKLHWNDFRFTRVNLEVAVLVSVEPII